MRGKQWALNRCGYDVACELPGAGRGVRWEWRGEGRRASPGWNLLFSSAQQWEQPRSVRLLSVVNPGGCRRCA